MSDAERTQHDAASANTPSHLRRTVHILMVVAGLTLLALIYVPLGLWSHSQAKLTGVAVLKPGINSVIWYLGGACALVMLVVSTVCSTCRGPDGQTYAFMESSFLQGQTLALGRVAPGGLLYKNFDILGHTNGDSPRSYALIARPRDKVRTTYGQLHLTNTGTMLGLRHDNRCYFAYDFLTKQFAGHGDIENISPFLLVDADSRLYETDVETLFKAPDAQPIGLPSRQVLLDAMNHANDEVRRVAEQLLARYDAE